MSAAIDSDKVLSEDGDTQAAEKSDNPFQKTIQNLDDRLDILSKNLSLCSSAMSDLHDLYNVLAKKRLQQGSKDPHTPKHELE